MRRQGNLSALEAAHERLARAKAEHARERLARRRNPGVPSSGPRPFPWWFVIALAILAYLVAWGVLAP